MRVWDSEFLFATGNSVVVQICLLQCARTRGARRISVGPVAIGLSFIYSVPDIRPPWLEPDCRPGPCIAP